MDWTSEFKSFQDQVTSSLVNVTRTANQISSEDLSFHRSSSTKLSKALDAQNSRLLQLTNKLLKAATKESNVRAPKIQNQDSIDDNWRNLVDVIDDLLEKADASLDEFTGILKRSTPPVSNNSEPPPQAKERPVKIPNVFSTSFLRKPQLDFLKPVNNFETQPFKPILETKPHAIIPLEQSIAPGEDGKYKHPYAVEIEQYRYPSSTYSSSPPILFTPPTESEAVFVDTEDGLLQMLSELKTAKEIAIDLEHHDMHSYIGLVCLMQISTRDKDWIVDTLKPWREKMQVLNEVFADPNILKVFHGSSMDMIWLQRDLGLYVVGLFDTFYASVALEFPRKALSYLLERFADFKAQKKYQMADWRIRPLPVELLDYARSDTHYLLFIYDQLRNMLIESSPPGTTLLDRVLAGSKKEALQVYERPIYNFQTGLGPAGWLKPLLQRSIKFDNIQFSVYRALHQWRDQKARFLDEGEQYVLTAAGLWELADKMPTTIPALHSVLRPISRSVSENAKELIEIIKQAKDDGQHGPSLRDIVREHEGKFYPPNVWTRKARINPHSEYEGIGKTVQMLAASRDTTVATPQELEEPQQVIVVVHRSNSSGLWGQTLSNAVSGLTSSVAAAKDALRSVLPIPTFSETLVSDAEVQNGQPAAQLAEVSAEVLAPPNDSVSETKADDIFVIRDSDRSRKRKADPILLDNPDLPDLPYVEGRYSAASGNQVPPTIPVNPILEARLKKQRKKAEKRQRQEAEAAVLAEMLAEKPFDYANAESILHAKPDGEALNGRASATPINPHLKALNTSTGAKRLSQAKEIAGRSMTFKS